jgi:DMATS type aromatic prenyltransferase
MAGAGYSNAFQERMLDFFSENVALYMGPGPADGRPQHWRSFMTDDYSPLEYSWAWESSPVIRFSFEPIGASAGSEIDQFNRTEPLKCVDRLRRTLPKSDWRWFDSIANSFYQEGASRLQGVSPDESSPSSILLAFDIAEKGVMSKVYFVPVKAEQTGQSRLSILHNAVGELQPKVDLPAYTYLDEYLHSQETVSPFDIIGVSVDCIDPSKSKLKIYARSHSTSFHSVLSTLSLGGKLSLWDEQSIDELRELWQLVLSLPESFPDDRELPHSTHETGGILYNFDVKKDNQYPETKIYIPVKHYGANDEAIAKGLVEFLARRGRDQHAQAFLQSIQQLCSYRALNESCGFQTYIACAVKKGKLSLTSYFSPEIYHPGRRSKRRMHSMN